jgi:hypothetical protein
MKYFPPSLFSEVRAPHAARTFFCKFITFFRGTRATRRARIFLQFCAPPSLFLEVRAPSLCSASSSFLFFFSFFAFRARAFAEHQHRDSIKYQRKLIDLNDFSTDFHQIQFSTSLRAF